MVEIATSLGRSGLQDWLFQRVSAVIVLFYIIFLKGYYWLHSPISYEHWHQLFSNSWMKIASVLVLFSLMMHAWIGIWSVTTDYLKPLILRLPVQLMVMMSLFGFLVWGIQILWDV
jgi:succinate dehydrogenase / fumarate reductase membrane anchor subunit